MPDVVILTLSDPSGCRSDACACGGGDKPRVPVLDCADALRAAGASVECATACDEAEIDTAIKPVETGEARLVVAAATDAELRAVVRRLVRRYAPPPSKRPAELPANRTVFDLPALSVLPLTPAIPGLVTQLGLPQTPSEVAGALLRGNERRYDLLRTDAGSVTLHGALLGGVGDGGRIVPWYGRVAVDDSVLSDGTEPILACAIGNAGRSNVDGLPLVVDTDPADGRVEIAVAVPTMKRRLLREASARVEVRRARGRAVSVTPRVDAGDVRYVDDGVVGVLTRKRTWWMEPGAWAAYVM